MYYNLNKERNILFLNGTLSFYLEVPNTSTIQEIIDKYRIFIAKKGWTYAIAADAIGCCRTHLGRIFNGLRVPSMTLLMKMEEVMKEK